MKTISYSKDAIKVLRRMPANMSSLIVSKIEQFAKVPASLGNNVKLLKGRPGELSLRVGEWRVIMTETGDVIAVIKIGPRGAIYEE